MHATNATNAINAKTELSRRYLPALAALLVILVSAALSGPGAAPGAWAASEEGKAVFAVG